MGSKEKVSDFLQKANGVLVASILLSGSRDYLSMWFGFQIYPGLASFWNLMPCILSDASCGSVGLHVRSPEFRVYSEDFNNDYYTVCTLQPYKLAQNHALAVYPMRAVPLTVLVFAVGSSSALGVFSCDLCI